MIAFQENLRRLRERAGITAKDFAEQIGIKYTTYMAYENEGREPKQETLCKIAAALHVSIDELLGFVPDKLNRWQNYFDGNDNLGFIAKDGTCTIIDGSDGTTSRHFDYKEKMAIQLFEAAEREAEKILAPAKKNIICNYIRSRLTMAIAFAVDLERRTYKKSPAE